MTILEQPKVKVYDFQNLDGETKYGFAIQFEQQSEHYTPYVTNSRAAIELFVDPIDFAEAIQDMGSKYTITPNAIVFEDECSAHVATEVLIHELHKQNIDQVKRKLYVFAKHRYFGKQSYYVAQLAKRHGISEAQVTQDMLEEDFELIVKLQQDKLIIDGDDNVFYRIKQYDIATGKMTAEDGTVFHADACEFPL